MLSQRILTRNLKADAYLDLVEAASGVALAGFLWSHMLFVCTILLGGGTFNSLSEFFDTYLLSYIGIPIVVVIFFVHFLVAGRRIPTRFRDQKIVWQHAKLLHHFDTWTWVFQAITGMAILVCGAIHMWLVTTGWPIRALTSAGRIESFWWFYLILLILGEYHASIGVYRVFVKWGKLPRKPISFVLKIVTLIMVVLGLAAIWAFYKVGGVA